MDARAVIIALREGRGLTPEAARWFAGGLADGGVDDAQAGAFAMAVLLKGLDRAGRVALTEAMRDSGDVLRWDLPGPVVDKHSTGGVGDTVSLILAPALAACGAFVPMISGRGLGHTGGTLDKMEAIPGYNALPDNDKLRQVVADCGCAIVGATGRIAPADRRLYAIRDISGTVESIDLITASILSKKLAAGLDALVLDVKSGSGAFMQTEGDARALAESLVGTANGAGCKTSALVTQMSQPLARVAGNALEVAEALRHLRDCPDTPLMQVSIALAAEALALSGLAPDVAAGDAKIREALSSGRAAEHFAKMVTALGGPADLLENPTPYLKPDTPFIRQVRATGVVQSIDTRALGEVVVHLGGGRLKLSDKLDMGVGLSDLALVGEPADLLATIHARSEAQLDAAEAAIRTAYTLGEAAPLPLILERIT